MYLLLFMYQPVTSSQQFLNVVRYKMLDYYFFHYRKMFGYYFFLYSRQQTHLDLDNYWYYKGGKTLCVWNTGDEQLNMVIVLNLDSGA